MNNFLGYFEQLGKKRRGLHGYGVHTTHDQLHFILFATDILKNIAITSICFSHSYIITFEKRLTFRVLQTA